MPLLFFCQFHSLCVEVTWHRRRLLKFTAVDDHIVTPQTRFGLFFDMGNGNSKYSYSSRHYDYRPFSGPVIPSQMTHANSTATGTGSTMPSYDMPRRKRKWYRFGSRDRHRSHDVWYNAYLSPERQQPSTPNIYCQFSSIFIPHLSP